MNRNLALIIAPMLLAAPPLQAQAPPPGWLADAKTGCKVWDPLPRKETVSWSGACENNLAQGRGVLKWSLGGISTGQYEGEVRDGRMNGRGVYTLPNGDRYDGDYRDGARAGRGVYTWPNGNRYEGQWLADKFSGHGILTMANGARYDGEWREDKRAGQGVITWPNGGRYEGAFGDNKPNGTGTLTSADGQRTYSGQWTNGCFRDGDRRATAGPTMKECGFE